MKMKINFQYEVYEKSFMTKVSANKKAKELKGLKHPCHVAFDFVTMRYYVCYD